MARPKKMKVKKRTISDCAGKKYKHLTNDEQSPEDTNNSKKEKCNQNIKGIMKRGTSKKVLKRSGKEQKIDDVKENAEYSCKTCGNSYKSQMSLKKHQKIHTAKKHQCHTCGRHFRRKCFLEKHAVTHTDDNPYKCHLCGKMFKNKEQLTIHHRIHSGEKPYQCDICGKDFSQNGNLRNHKKIHAPENTFYCDICGKEFEHNKDLLSHVLTHNNGTIFKCFECGKMFGRKDHFEKHKELHSENRPFSCDVCGQSYKKNFELKCHLKLHSKDQSYICDHCGKSFSYKSSLNYHIRTHTGAKPYTCDICGKSFSTSSNRSKHVLSHSDFKPFKCCHCSKAFLVKSALIIHERTHTGSRPYQCGKCLKTFIVRAELNRHLRKVHKETFIVRTETNSGQIDIELDESSPPCIYQKDSQSNMTIITDVQRHGITSYSIANSQSSGAVATSIEKRAVGRSVEGEQSFKDTSNSKKDIETACVINSSHFGHVNSVRPEYLQNTTLSSFTDSRSMTLGNEQLLLSPYIQDISVTSSEQLTQTSHYGVSWIKPLPPNSHESGLLANSDSNRNSCTDDTTAQIRKHLCNEQHTALRSQTSFLLNMDNLTSSDSRRVHPNQISSETDVQNTSVIQGQGQILQATDQFGVCNDYLTGPGNRTSDDVLPDDVHAEHLNSISNTNHNEEFCSTPDKFAKVQHVCEKDSDKTVGKSMLIPASPSSLSGISSSAIMPDENVIEKTISENISQVTNHTRNDDIVRDAVAAKDDDYADNDAAAHDDEEEDDKRNYERFDGISQSPIIEGVPRKEDVTFDTTNKTENPDVVKNDDMMNFQLNQEDQIESERSTENHGQDESNIDSLSHINRDFSTASKKSRIKQNKKNRAKRTKRKERIKSKPYDSKACNKRSKGEQENRKSIATKCQTNKSLYACEFCDKTYGSKISLQGHMKIHRPREHRCSVCQREFRRLACLTRHLKVHTEDNPYRCSYCSKDFSRQDKLKLHLRKHTGDKPYQCEKCGKHFSQYGNLLTHTKIHSAEKAFRCNECGSEFMNNKELLSHITCHGLHANRCEVCGKMFGRKEHLVAHMDIHTGERRFKCKICNRGFLNSNDCKSHEVTHTDDKAFACEYCGKRFHRKSGLVYHIRTHTGAKPYTCNICGKAFRTNSYLNKHAMFHLGFKPHKCDICDKAFYVKKDLTVHLRIHTGERPFKCTVCDKGFKEGIALRKHMVFMHTCPTCGSTFREKNELKSHIASH